MSKERGLLNNVAVMLKFRGICPLLLKEISELLNEPERPDWVAYRQGVADGSNYACGEASVPVAWRGINFTEAEGKWLYRDLDEPFTDHNFNNVGEALYLAPPNREPLSNITIKEASRGATDMSFYNGVKFAEKAHGIGVDDE